MTDPKDWRSMSDKECVQTEVLCYNAMCKTHNQPLIECANGRLGQVKAARVMDERSTASARAWQQQANETRKEINELKADLRKSDWGN
jgi:hypothetical protein